MLKHPHAQFYCKTKSRSKVTEGERICPLPRSSQAFPQRPSRNRVNVPQSVTTFCNDGRSSRSLGTFIRSLAPRNIFYAIFTDGKIDKFITKNFFPSVSISIETYHDWLSFYAGIKVFMFNLKTVVVINFEPIIIMKLLWRNWSHNISVLKSINIKTK